MSNTLKLGRRAKLTDLAPQHRAAFEQRIPWVKILKVFQVEHQVEEESDESITVTCPACELEGGEHRVSLSSGSKTFKCSECETKAEKLDFVGDRFSHDPTVAEITALFGEDCFGPNSVRLSRQK